MCQGWFSEMNSQAANLKGRNESFLDELDLAGEIAAERNELMVEYNRFTAECGDSGDYVP